MSLPPIAEPTADVGKTFVARYAYQARTAEDLSFEKGEQLIVSGRGSNDNREVIFRTALVQLAKPSLAGRCMGVAVREKTTPI